MSAAKRNLEIFPCVIARYMEIPRSARNDLMLVFSRSEAASSCCSLAGRHDFLLFAQKKVAKEKGQPAAETTPVDEARTRRGENSLRSNSSPLGSDSALRRPAQRQRRLTPICSGFKHAMILIMNALLAEH